MSKFFKALEQAQRDAEREQAAGAQPQPVAGQRPAAAPSDPPSARGSTATPAPEPPRTVFTAPTPPRVTPRAAEPARSAIEAPRGDAGLLEDRLVSLRSPSSQGAERYRVLRHVVETLRKRANLQVLAVTSPAVGDGKTMTAINLAGALAQAADARVLLVDLDLRRPTVARQLGLIDARPTLVDALASPELALKDAVCQVPKFNLSVLRAPASAPAPYELLRSPRLEALLAEARQQYDYVVVDTPPFVPFPDCRLIAKCVDGFAIVIAANRTPRGLLAETLKAMDPEKSVGLVFNADAARDVGYEEAYGRMLWRRKEEIS